MLFYYILLATLGVAMITTIIITIKVEKIKKNNYEQVNSKESLTKLEGKLNNYLKDNDMPIADFDAICSKNNVKIEKVSQFSKKLKGGAEASVDNAEDGGYTIFVADNIDERKHRFVVAHELVHVILGDPLPGNREKFGVFIRTVPEQERDYIAAAILLPLKEFGEALIKANYFNSDESSKNRFIDEVSATKQVERDLVIKRINEFQIING